MNKKICLIAVVLSLIFCASCTQEDPPTPLNLPAEASQVIASSNAFGFELFKQVIRNAEAGKNVMVSPLSVSLALSMTYNGAAGETRTAFEQTLMIGDLGRDQFNDVNKQLVTALLAHDSRVILEIANSIWYRQEYQILQGFIDRNQNFYNADVRPSDFDDPRTLDKINGWVDEKTHHKIDKIIDQINPESFMFLINAIYFKGTWEYEFDKKETRDADFSLGEDAYVSVPFMHQKMDIDMLSNDLFSAVELPYGKGNWRMYLFLPNPDRSLDDLVGQLTIANWTNWINAFTPSKEVSVSIPKFKFSFEQSLNDALTVMGLGVAFTSEADFRDMAPGLPLSISQVKHKTFIEVNEEGTEAAAVTSVEIVLTGIGNFFFANRPFLYTIVEKSTGTILFIGQVVNPSLNE